MVVRSKRFFRADGGISSDTLNRFGGLVASFPHGPVSCQVAVPNDQSRVWGGRVARLADRLARTHADRRISTSMVVTKSLEAGTVQCTFAAYRAP